MFTPTSRAHRAVLPSAVATHIPEMKTENHRILIIDDERPVLMTLEALLQRHGYQVDTAPTASQGLKLLKSKSPSLVLLDLQLPDAQVLEMIDHINTELPDMQV